MTNERPSMLPTQDDLTAATRDARRARSSSASVLAFAPMHNTHGKSDATGAFQPEAMSFAKHWSQLGSETVIIDNELSVEDMRVRVLGELALRPRIRCAAFFCHGWKGGLQLGFRLAHVPLLADALAKSMLPTLSVALYACDAGRDSDSDAQDDLLPGPGGQGGFASLLREALITRRPDWIGNVDAHTSVAHSTKNPHVRRFSAAGESRYLIGSDSPLWPSWRLALRSTDLRFRFPMMTRADITQELTTGRVA